MLINSKFISEIAKRKTACAKIFLKLGTGLILINNKPFEKYFFSLNNESNLITYPLQLVNISNTFDIIIFVKGGGLHSQLEASIAVISKALAKYNLAYRSILKKNLLLRSDSRIKERRKYGLKKARKASQYSKR